MRGGMGRGEKAGRRKEDKGVGWGREGGGGVQKVLNIGQRGLKDIREERVLLSGEEIQGPKRT